MASISTSGALGGPLPVRFGTASADMAGRAVERGPACDGETPAPIGPECDVVKISPLLFVARGSTSFLLGGISEKRSLTSHLHKGGVPA